MTQPPRAIRNLSKGDDRLDPAQQSLADALRVSFWVLKLFMVGLVVLYLFSGVFSVREQETAVRLRFGRIVGLPHQQVLEPGGPYFSLPYPLEQVVVIPTAPHQIQIDKAFWYESVDRGLASGRPGPLNPEKDGSLLTGDAEIVHTRWSVTYTVDDPIQYLKNVKDAKIAHRLVRAVAEQCVIGSVAGLTADELIRSQNPGRALQRAQEVLDGLKSGVRVTTFSVKDPAFPLSVQPAVREAINAESVRAQMIDQAQEKWNQVLVGTAGAASERLLEVVDAYELAIQGGAEQRLAELEKLLDESFTTLSVPIGNERVSISGTVAQMIYEAQAYRTQVVAQVRSEAEYFSSLLPHYQKNRRIVANRLWQDTKDRIFTGDIETMYLPRGQVYLELNRDPKIRQERERMKLVQEEQDRQATPRVGR